MGHKNNPHQRKTPASHPENSTRVTSKGPQTVEKMKADSGKPSSLAVTPEDTGHIARTRSQNYASLVLKRIMVRKNEEDPQKYKARADSFPIMVIQSGLAQATGFMLAKGSGDKNSDQRAYQNYLDDLATVFGNNLLPDVQDGSSLHGKVISTDLAEYRRLTREALIIAAWFKRFGQVHLRDQKLPGDNK